MGPNIVEKIYMNILVFESTESPIYQGPPYINMP